MPHSQGSSTGYYENDNGPPARGDGSKLVMMEGMFRNLAEVGYRVVEGAVCHRIVGVVGIDGVGVVSRNDFWLQGMTTMLVMGGPTGEFIIRGDISVYDYEASVAAKGNERGEGCSIENLDLGWNKYTFS